MQYAALTQIAMRLAPGLRQVKGASYLGELLREQPRKPAGDSDGGQFAPADGGAGKNDVQHRDPHAVSGIGPTEIGLLPGESHAQASARLGKGAKDVNKQMAVLYRYANGYTKQTPTEAQKKAALAHRDKLLKHRAELMKAVAKAEAGKLQAAIVTSGNSLATAVPTPKPVAMTPKVTTTKPTGDSEKDKHGELVKVTAVADYTKAHTEWVAKTGSSNAGKAIAAYTGSAYLSIRKAESGAVAATPAATAQIAGIREALKSAPEYPGAVTRGIGALPPAVAKALTTVGGVYTTEAVTSFTKKSSPTFGAQYKLFVSGKNGSGGADVTKLSHHPSEDEVLVPKGTKYKITHVEEKTFMGSISTHVYMEKVA